MIEKNTALSWDQVCASLRFRHLQFLDILGRVRNLRITAEQMHVTQPAATKTLADIEAIFGARLFERLPRDMRPSDLGLFVLRYARATMAEGSRFVSEFETLKRGGHGHVTVGAISGSAARLMTEAIQEIHRLRPLLVVKVLEQSSDQLIVWLEEKKLDIMLGRFTQTRHQSLYDYETLAGETVWIVAGAHHPLLSDRAGPDLGALVDWPWILYPPATALRQLFEETFASAGLVVPAGTVETPSFFSAFELLQATPMLSMQPQAIVEKYVDKALLGRIPVPIRDTMPDYGVITRKGEVPSRSMREFIDILHQVAGQP
ncbi:LysR family transcriptional regulator [Bordetella sp. FB-8]|uniref:LysR family transcriptional regulator n=1 Tax=Bordetella sp. FB-8 TaxID=1159870 RepID=UPI00037A7C5B|nr:LysR family transcriptional regulator [Bordetella sp. FB-8]